MPQVSNKEPSVSSFTVFSILSLSLAVRLTPQGDILSLHRPSWSLCLKRCVVLISCHQACTVHVNTKSTYMHI